MPVKKPKKAKKAGDRIIWRIRENENQEIIDWLNTQENISESIRVLIQEEVAKNGLIDKCEAEETEVDTPSVERLKENILEKQSVQPDQKSIPKSSELMTKQKAVPRKRKKKNRSIMI